MSGSRSLVGYVAVALISLTVGAAATFVALRRPAAPSAGASPAGHGQAAGAPASPGEHPSAEQGSTVYISPARQQLIGVRTAKVGPQDLAATIRTVGTLAYDETRITRINTKISGWVDRVHVDYVGKFVRRGDPLFAVYSPQLVATQKEYLIALQNRQRLAEGPFHELEGAGESLIASTRERLTLWDISDAQIAELERTGQVRRTLTLHAPFDGVVLEREAFPGQYITPEMTTFRIADLSTIWAYGQIFEYELGRVKLGQDVEVDFPYGQEARTLQGRLAFIYPDVDPQTRRVKIRAEFANPGFVFKPESYVTLVIKSDAGRGLAVPKEAVIDTGAKRYVILAHPNGYFEPREVEVGPPVDEFYPLAKGLREGEAVVTSAQFLVDSETNLKAAMQAMSMSMRGMDMGGEKSGGGKTMEGMEMPGEPAPPSEHGGHGK